MSCKSVWWFIAAGVLVLTIWSLSPAQTKVNVGFAKGKTSTTLNGTIKGRRYLDYAIKASQGQTMTVTLARRSGEAPYFNVITDSSEVAIADDAREVTEWSGVLPAMDTYIVRVYVSKAARLANRTSNFRLTISVTDVGENDSAETKTVFYKCEGDVSLTADFMPGPPKQVRIRFGTQDINLPLEPSGSGSKYEFNNQMFWVKGKTAVLESKVLNANCTVKE